MLNLVFWDVCTNWPYLVFGMSCRNRCWKWTCMVFDLFFEEKIYEIWTYVLFFLC